MYCPSKYNIQVVVISFFNVVIILIYVMESFQKVSLKIMKKATRPTKVIEKKTTIVQLHFHHCNKYFKAKFKQNDRKMENNPNKI